MKEHFILNPQNNTLEEITKLLVNREALLPINKEDVRRVVEGSSNIIILAGHGSGKKRVKEAIEDALSHANKVASGHNILFCRDMILNLSYPEKYPLIMDELIYVTDFVGKMYSQLEVVLGANECRDRNEDRLEAKIIMSDLEKR